MTRLLIRMTVTATMMGTGVVPAATLSVWSVDPDLKVFRDTAPAGNPAVAISMRAAGIGSSPRRLPFAAMPPSEPFAWS